MKFVLTRSRSGAVGLALLVVAFSGLDRPVDASWRLRLVDSGGFDDRSNRGITRMVAEGDYFYAGTWNIAVGTKIYRSRDGEEWVCISRPGIDGNRNSFATVGLVWHGDYLYVGTWNQ